MPDRYVAVTGLNYVLQPGPGEGRCEPGDDVPEYVVQRSPWLLEQGAVTVAVVAPDTDAPQDGV